MTIKLNEQQAAALEEMRVFADEWPHGAWAYTLQGYAGTGKLQPLDEPVLTPEGWRRMGDIKPGHYVMAGDGTPTQVLQVFPGKDLDIYKVTFSDGTWTECCEDHLWKVQTRRQSQRGNWSVKALKDLLPGIAEGARRTIGGNNKGYMYSIPLCQPVQFAEKALPVKPYMLGYMLGNGYHAYDGANVVQISMWKQDAEEIMAYLESISHVRTYENVVQAVANGIPVIGWKQVGLSSKRSGDKFIPDIYLKGSMEQRRALLAGLMDSDGTCSCGKARFSTTSQQLAADMVELVRSLGGMAFLNWYDRTAEGKTKEAQISLRTPFNPFRLSRKAEKYGRKATKHQFKKQIAKAEYVGKKDGQCLLVDNREHLYITRDYVVTHNTFTIQQLVPLLREMDMPVAFSAPTHKAVKVLGAMARKAGIGVPCATIHSLLSLKVGKDQDQTKIERDPNGKETARQYRVIVVDECSMVGKALFGFIQGAAERYGIKFIFMGDPAQLPPVGEDISPTLLLDGARLTQVMRQRGEHPILGLCTDIRDMMMAGDFRLPTVTPQCEDPCEIGLHVMAGSYFREYMPTAFSHENFDANPDRFRVVAWTNLTVENYNKEIQEFRYPGLSTLFAEGEPVVFSGPAMVRATVGGEKSYENDIVVSTETEGRVIGVPEHRQHPVYPEIMAWRVDVTLETGAQVAVWTLDKLGRNIFDCLLRDKAAKAKAKQSTWWDYWQLREAFADIRPAYCLTSHKAQGSTFENVFVDVLNIWRNPNKAEALQCLYVACSRASHHLILNAGG